MSPLLFVLWSVVCVLGAGGLVYFVMNSRMEVRLARLREEMATERASLESRRAALEDSIKGAEQAARSKALDEVLADIRVEERHYVREHRALFLTRKSVVRQERIFFRNIPLSNWVEQEMQVDEGADIEKLAQTMAIFGADLLPAAADAAPRRLLR